MDETKPLSAEQAFHTWWEGLGHAERCYRPAEYTMEAFEAGFRAAQTAHGHMEESERRDLRYCEGAEAHADEGPIGNPAALSLVAMVRKHIGTIAHLRAELGEEKRLRVVEHGEKMELAVQATRAGAKLVQGVDTLKPFADLHAEATKDVQGLPRPARSPTSHAWGCGDVSLTWGDFDRAARFVSSHGVLTTPGGTRGPNPADLDGSGEPSPGVVRSPDDGGRFDPSQPRQPSPREAEVLARDNPMLPLPERLKIIADWLSILAPGRCMDGRSVLLRAASVIDRYEGGR